MHVSRIRRLFLSAPLLVACATGAGCGSEPDTAPDLAARLEEDTGVSWTVVRDPSSHEVTFMAPARAVKVGDGPPEDVARAFFIKYRDALHGTGSPLELRAQVRDADPNGASHVRFLHFVPGTEIAVHEAATTVTFNATGEFVYAMPSFREGVGAADPKPTGSETEVGARANALALRECALSDEASLKVRNIELIALPRDGRAPTLAWRVDWRIEGGSCAAPEALIDATTGDTLGFRETAERVLDQATGVWFHHGNDPNDRKWIDVSPDDQGGWVLVKNGTVKVSTQTHAPGWAGLRRDIHTKTLGSWTSSASVRGAEVDAHHNMVRAVTFFEEAFKLKGPDGMGGPVAVVVHSPDFPNDDCNAYFTPAGKLAKGTLIRVLDGNFFKVGKQAGTCLPLTSFDVMVHEASHSVTEHTSSLVYRQEPGALNESFSDVMAAYAAHRALESDEDAFKIGKRGDLTGIVFRNMLDPSLPTNPNNPQSASVAHVSNMPACATPTAGNDMCGVHRNSGIPNRAFSLMAVGGQHAQSKVWVRDALGWQRASELWYRTHIRLSPTANFLAMANAQVAYAVQFMPDALAGVACAWRAVGVFGGANTNAEPAAITSLTCPSLAAPSTPSWLEPCGNVKDGFACNPFLSFSGHQCVGGQAKSTLTCAGLQRCKHPSSSDWTATLAPDGTLVCEN